MLNVNEYFNGAVKSIALNNNEGDSTVGVMEPGEYEFGTTRVEYMNVVSGALTVLLPNETEWKTYSKGEVFRIDKDQKFQVKVAEQTVYLCIYK